MDKQRILHKINRGAITVKDLEDPEVKAFVLAELESRLGVKLDSKRVDKWLKDSAVRKAMKRVASEYEPSPGQLDLGEAPVRVHGYTVDGTTRLKIHLFSRCGASFNAQRKKNEHPTLRDVGIVEVPGTQICAVCARRKIQKDRKKGRRNQ